MKYATEGEVEAGVLHLADRDGLRAALAGWPDCVVEITIESEAATRSARANAYYWKCVVKPLAEYTGYTAEETHDNLKRLFLSKEVAIRRRNGQVVADFVIGGSTKRLYGFEFYDYIERIRQWAFDELEIDIEPPDAEWREKVLAEKRAIEGVA